VATVALALTLLAGAGLLVKSFARLVGVDPGFKPDHLLTFNISLPQLRYKNDTLQIAAFERITSALEAVPGATKVGATSTLPFSGQWSTGSFNIEGYQVPKGAPGPWGDQRVVTPNFLSTLGAPLLKGRLFGLEDRAGTPRVVIVDQEMVNRYWPKDDPIGKRITFNQLTDLDHPVDHRGGCGRTHQPRGSRCAAASTDVPPASAVRGQLDELRHPDSGRPKRPAAQPEGSRSGDRPRSPILESLDDGGIGRAVHWFHGASPCCCSACSRCSPVGLASIGLYGVMSYNVTQRSRELGVRLALGAATKDLLGLVLRQGMRLVIIGVMVGLVAALAATRLLRSMLFNVSSSDPLTFVLIALLLLGVSLVAIWIPARRATKVDPIVALRAE
jgi:putative ABC transport system permease protein